MEPKNADWLKLYEAADQFKKLKPWEWLSNVHLFGVRSPRDGRTGYCCVMGSGGEMYGMAVYLGTGGLQTVLDMLNGEFVGDPLFAQHCFMLSFDSRDDLYPKEYKQIKELGLSYRGKNNWPTFRLYEPGYVPWPLMDRDDLLFLTEVIGQAVEVSRAYRQDPDALLEGNGERFLVRIPVAGEEGGTTEWISEWRKPDPADRPLEPTGRLAAADELRMAKAKRAVQTSVGVWEVDSFFVPMPIEEEGRPFYPTMNVIADQESGQLLHYGMTKEIEAHDNLAEGLLKLIETHRVVPSLLVAAEPKVLDKLAPVLTGLRLECLLVPELPAIEEFQHSMRGQLL